MRSLAILTALTMHGSGLTMHARAAGPWPICDHGQPRAACVHDGDTVWLDGTKIRLWTTAAPEIGHRASCDAEHTAGIRARDRLAVLLGSGSVAVITDGDLDRYGRLLAGLTVDGAGVETVMIGEGITLPYDGTTRAERTAHWCGR